MADHLRDVARSVERSVDVPDFDEIVVRGHALRRRRRQRNALAWAAAALAVIAVAVPWARETTDSSPEPADPVRTDSQRTALILSDPAAVVDDAETRVADGAVLQRVSVPSPAGGRCDADRRTALVWQDWAGSGRAWSAGVAGREVAAASGGFVVGAVPPACAARLGEPRQGAYVVDADGLRHEVVWADGAEATCASHPGEARCRIDVATARGEVVEGARSVPGPGYLETARSAETFWASTTDLRRLAWSHDGGRSWEQRTTSLRPPRGEVVQSTAAGDWGVFFVWPRVQFTRDGGRTWSVRDLRSALSPVLVANPVIHVTSSGQLVGVSYPPGERPFLFSSSDPSWESFERDAFRTGGGDYALSVSGRWVYAQDAGSVWLSPDGRTWREVVPRTSPGSR